MIVVVVETGYFWPIHTTITHDESCWAHWWLRFSGGMVSIAGRRPPRLNFEISSCRFQSLARWLQGVGWRTRNSRIAVFNRESRWSPGLLRSRS